MHEKELSVKSAPSRILTRIIVNLQLYTLLLAKITMRFISLILAVATATLFNVYATAKPVMASSLDSAGHLQVQLEDGNSCDTYTCSLYCKAQGSRFSRCVNGYVQIPSNKFVLRLTI